MPRAVTFWLVLGGIAIAVLPWYGLEGDGLLALDWIRAYPSADTGPALYQIVAGGRPWLLLPALPWLLVLAGSIRGRLDAVAGRWLAVGAGH